jgi:transcriptional regulator with XRE-family HTH domain
MNPITTANKLKTLRTLKGLNPEQVAEKAKLNLDDYKALEEGKTAVPHDKLEKACNALGVDIKEWFETDKSSVFINNGEIKGGSGNLSHCENCYFYDRNEEDMDMIKDVTLALKEVINKLDSEWIWRGMERFLKEEKLKGSDKKA